MKTRIQGKLRCIGVICSRVIKPRENG